MTTSNFTEEEIAEIVDKLEDDFGLFVGIWMNKHESDGVDIKIYDPDGTFDKFEIRRITTFQKKQPSKCGECDYCSTITMNGMAYCTAKDINPFTDISTVYVKRDSRPNWCPIKEVHE